MLPVAGYDRWSLRQGQIRICINPQISANFHESSFYLEDPHKATAHLLANKLSAVPVANFFVGVYDIFDALRGENHQNPVTGEHVHQDDMTRYRVIQFLVGVAEITLVGGWIVHGGMTLYYYATRPLPEGAAI